MKWVVTGSNDVTCGRQETRGSINRDGDFIYGLECLPSYRMIITVPQKQSMQIAPLSRVSHDKHQVTHTRCSQNQNVNNGYSVSRHRFLLTFSTALMIQSSVALTLTFADSCLLRKITTNPHVLCHIYILCG